MGGMGGSLFQAIIASSQTKFSKFLADLRSPSTEGCRGKPSPRLKDDPQPFFVDVLPPQSHLRSEQQSARRLD